MNAPGPSRFISLGTKLSAVIVSLLAFIFTFVYFEATERTRQSLVEIKENAAAMIADLAAQSLAAPLDFQDRDAAQSEISRLAQSSDVIYAAVWESAGETPIAVLLTEGRGKITGMPASREPRTAVLGDRIEAVRTVVGPSGKELGGVVIHFSLARENESYGERQRRLLFLSLSLAGGLSAVLIAVARRIILSPIARLAEAARRLEWGAQAKVEVTSNDEIGRLGSAFNAMADAIALREQWLAAARSSLQEVLDNMRQAIVVFGREGLVEGASSRQAGLLFLSGSLMGGSLSGRPIKDLLYPGAVPHDIEAMAFDEWLSHAFSVRAEGWDEIVALAPHEVRVQSRSGEELILELEFRPVLEDGRVARVMLLATDATDRRRLERAMQSQERQHAMQMAAMRRLIASGTQLFVSFLHGVKERLARCRAILGAAPGSLRIAEIDEIFQHVHTIKSEARAFDLRALAEAAKQIEDRLAEVCGLAREGARLSLYEQDLRIELRDRLRAAEAAVANARTLFVEASPIGAAVLDQVTVSRSTLLELSDLVREKGASARGAVPIEKLARIVSAVMSRPFGESTAPIVEAAPEWASSVSKQLELEVDGREVLVPNELASALGGVLAHLVRNAIAHGIEPPEERVRLGKPRVGRVRVTCVDPGGAEGLRITVEDDGRGLDLDALRAKALSLGVSVPREGPAELVFSQGISTAESVDDIAGRGVGLAAVRAELVKIGWAIFVQSESSRGARFVVTRPRSGLRPGAV